MTRRRGFLVLICIAAVLSLCWSVVIVTDYCRGIQTLRGVTLNVETISITPALADPVVLSLQISSASRRPYTAISIAATLERDGQTVAIQPQRTLDVPVVGLEPTTLRLALQPGLDFQEADALRRIQEASAGPWKLTGEINVGIPRKHTTVRMKFSLQYSGS